MSESISCAELAALMAADSLYAVLDVRERGEFHACQIAGATSLPRSQIEFCIRDLVPNKKVPLVVYGDEGRRAPLAAVTLGRFGYRDVKVLQGGLPAWRRAGRPTASGVNVPSKAFGERVRAERNVPEISPEELKILQEQGADLVILDMRTPEEFGRFCIPGAVNVPGGEIILWADRLSEHPEKKVIVNCAGRTRSIVGAAGLLRLGVSHARALRNGTMGWVLAGFDLEAAPARLPAIVPQVGGERALPLALRLAEEEGIPQVSPAALMALQRRGGILYLIDVRSESEFAAGHLPGSLNVPGGQAVQRADDFIAVRNGDIVFVSDGSARAIMTAYWYRQMGYRGARILKGGLRAWSENGGSLDLGVAAAEPLGYSATARAARFIDPGDLEQKLKGADIAVIDTGLSLDFESAHIPGARWISRGWLEAKLAEYAPDRSRTMVLACADGRQSVLAAQALTGLGYGDVMVLSGGVRAWAQSGRPTESGTHGCLMEPDDVVLSPSIRGTREDMRRYLEWEVKLTGG